MEHKVLMLSYRAPFPVKSGDKIRMFQNILLLSERYDVDLIYLDDNTVEDDTSELGKYCNKVLKFKSSRIRMILNGVLRNLFQGLPLQVGYFYNKEMQRWIEENILNYKIVFCNHLRTAEYVMSSCKNVDGIIKAIDNVDAISLNYKNKSLVNTGLRKLIYTFEYKKIIKYEKEVYDKFDNTMIISERDKQFICNDIGVKKPPHIVVNFVRDLGYSENIKNDGKNDICFIGKMSTEPNVNAILYFIKEIFPFIKEKYNDLHLNIIGGNVSNEIKKFEKISGINVLGFVDKPGDIIQTSKLVVAPMISGSGLQNKIIESMYLGKLVITTEIGANGLHRLSGDELVVAKDTEDFVNKLMFYLDDKNKDMLNKLGKIAREYVINQYGYMSVREQFYKAIKRLKNHDYE